MVYIYKKKLGNKTYYYLRASIKKGAKTLVKDLAYLGSSIRDVKQALDKLPKYRDQIRKTYKTINSFLESNCYLEKAKALNIKRDAFLDKKLEEIEACKLHYNQVFQKKNQLTKDEIIKNFIVEFAFNTTSIEGNTITLQQARNLLENGRTPKNKTLREIYDLQNTEKVFLSLLESAEKISHQFIINIHRNLMANIDNRIGYRTEEVRVFKARFKSTPAPYVNIDMNLLLKWYNKNKATLHPFVLAVVFHHKFEKIHPFMDGNGRTGRMLMNYILLKNSYPPIILSKKDHSKYLIALSKADKSNPADTKKEHYFNLIQFSADEFTNNYWNIFL